MIENLKILCAIPGVSGTEDAVRDFIEHSIRPYCDDIKTDALGNLIAFKKGRTHPGRLMICAHMDEVGLIVTDITDDGYLKFACVGGIDKRVLFGKRVFIGDSLVPGVTGNKAIHLIKSEERDRIPDVESMYIDIGCSAREEAEKLVSRGDNISFEPSVYQYGNGYFKAKALDDRIGCAIMLDLIKSPAACDTFFVFTVQEEVGTRGATAASFNLNPDIALILETTTAADFPSVKGDQKICCLGNGVVISLMDGGTIYDKKLYSFITEKAESAGIPHQIKTRIAGGTDARAVQRSGAGHRVCGLAIPVRNIHSPASCGCIKDMESMQRLAEIVYQEVYTQI